ncbi:MAG: hypothetical protein R3240_09315 [Gammaproteobacteria bacterium]|nr:hypothetical protein [Gammaproteobacteria bacterium]
MTLIELFSYLNENTPHQFFSSEAELASAISGTHENPLMGQMIKLIAEKNQCTDINDEVKREVVVTALGPLRLEYMKDDAPVEGFRLLEGTIPVIDLAFNDEALKNKT